MPDCAFSSLIWISLLARSKTLLRDLDTVAQIVERGQNVFEHWSPSVHRMAHNAPLSSS
jgi:hypothetical protein